MTCGIHLMAISWKMLKISILDMSSKITATSSKGRWVKRHILCINNILHLRFDHRSIFLKHITIIYHIQSKSNQNEWKSYSFHTNFKIFVASCMTRSYFALETCTVSLRVTLQVASSQQIQWCFRTEVFIPVHHAHRSLWSSSQGRVHSDRDFKGINPL